MLIHTLLFQGALNPGIEAKVLVYLTIRVTLNVKINMLRSKFLQDYSKFELPRIYSNSLYMSKHAKKNFH